MKNLKKNNKGFSLVELIVVVLIIAIIAVALAPQVTKWVKTAKDSTTANNKATLQATVQTCVTEGITLGYDVVGKVIVTNGTAASDTTDTVDAAFVTLINNALANFTEQAIYTVTIDSAYKVSVQ